MISSNVLSEELVLEVLAQLRQRLAERAKTTTSAVPKLEKEAARLKTEIERLVLALAILDARSSGCTRAMAVPLGSLRGAQRLYLMEKTQEYSLQEMLDTTGNSIYGFQSRICIQGACGGFLGRLNRTAPWTLPEVT
jgi:hypothetical protein